MPRSTAAATRSGAGATPPTRRIAQNMAAQQRAAPFSFASIDGALAFEELVAAGTSTHMALRLQPRLVLSSPPRVLRFSGSPPPPPRYDRLPFDDLGESRKSPAWLPRRELEAPTAHHARHYEAVQRLRPLERPTTAPSVAGFAGFAGFAGWMGAAQSAEAKGAGGQVQLQDGAASPQNQYSEHRVAHSWRRERERRCASPTAQSPSRSPAAAARRHRPVGLRAKPARREQALALPARSQRSAAASSYAGSTPLASPLRAHHSEASLRARTASRERISACATTNRPASVSNECADSWLKVTRPVTPVDGASVLVHRAERPARPLALASPASRSLAQGRGGHAPVRGAPPRQRFAPMPTIEQSQNIFCGEAGLAEFGGW